MDREDDEDRWALGVGIVLGGLLLASVGACDTAPRVGPAEQRTLTQDARLETAPKRLDQPSAPPPNEGARGAPGSSKLSAAGPTLACPSGMVKVPGGKFWVGTEAEVYDSEENPKFSTRVADFCADIHEVSTAEYEACDKAGKCGPLVMTNKTCNRTNKGRQDHPINCITFKQAEEVCRARDARLPTEIEWEYMARGGAEMRDYPWGGAAPDGHTCWKQAGTCERGQFAAGAFGLYDVVGNVWEWTSSTWGRYPWPAKDGDKRVYRGGGWSRRFDKWMRPTLRNRQSVDEAGSHLGVRCVLTLEGTDCPYGKDSVGACKFGVEEVLCLDKTEWNGVRCANPRDAERCAPGTHEEAGHGCVREKVAGLVDRELDTAAVVRTRSPEFDADCARNQPSRPHAYRLEGGEHLARNAAGKSLGCKNRDVGVGFNSCCCP